MEETILVEQRAGEKISGIARPKVLIASDAEWSSLSELPFLFKEAGCIVDVFCQRKSWLIRNKYFDKWIKHEPHNFPFEKKLYEVVQDGHYDFVLIADDSSLERMNRFLRDLPEEDSRKILPLTKLEHRHLINSKSGFTKFCQTHDLLCPKSIIFNEGVTKEEEIIKIGFPVVLKEDRGNSGSGVHLLMDRNELEKKIKTIRNKNNLVVQKFIPGKLVNIEALFKNGEVLMYNYSEKLKTIDREFSISTLRSFSSNKDIEPQLKQLGENLGINGFGNITYIFEQESKKYYLIEADLRPNAWFAYGRFTGADFSLGIKKFFRQETDEDKKVTTSQTGISKIEIAIFSLDIKRCFIQKDFKGLVKWLINYDDHWKYIPVYDCRLFRRMTLNTIASLVKLLALPRSKN